MGAETSWIKLPILLVVFVIISDALQQIAVKAADGSCMAFKAPGHYFPAGCFNVP